jgi:hypothetical protein
MQTMPYIVILGDVDEGIFSEMVTAQVRVLRRCVEVGSFRLHEFNPFSQNSLAIELKRVQ